MSTERLEPSLPSLESSLFGDALGAGARLKEGADCGGADDDRCLRSLVSSFSFFSRGVVTRESDRSEARRDSFFSSSRGACKTISGALMVEWAILPLHPSNFCHF